MRIPAVVCLTLAAIPAATPARAQYVQIQSFEVAPFIGARLGGAFKIQPDEAVPVEAELQDATSYGLSAGVRFDDFSLVEFRWTRASSALRFPAPFVFLGASVGDVTLNQFHADFTREFVIPEVKGLRAFFTGSLGATLPSSQFTLRNADFAPNLGTINNVASFGVDQAGNLYIVD